MHCLRSDANRGNAQSPVRWLLISVLLLGYVQADGAGFEVRDAEIRLVNGVYLLDVDLDLDFSYEVLDALESGVPLTVVVDMQILRPRRAIWDERVAKVQARYQLQVHPLSKQYVLKNLNSGGTRTFRDLDAAMAELATVQDFPLLDAHLLQGEQRYTLRVRARLDIEALPSPLRPMAYLSSLWRLRSDWYAWSIER